MTHYHWMSFLLGTHETLSSPLDSPVGGKGVALIVHGEIYLVTSSTLALIDNLEGHPHFYKREIIQDIFNYEKKYSLWSYLFEKSQLSELNLIKNGIF